MGLTKHDPIRSARAEEYWVATEFDTNNTSAPDGVLPGWSQLAVARADVGDFTLTFDATHKPRAIHWADACVFGDEPNLFAKVTGYTASTGVVTLTVYQNSGGTIAAADTTDKKIKVALLCTRADIPVN